MITNIDTDTSPTITDRHGRREMKKALISLAFVFLSTVTIVSLVTRTDSEQKEHSSFKYRLIEGWIDPDEIGLTSAVDVDAEGNVYAFRRDPDDVWKLSPDGMLLEQWEEIAEWAHGIRIDSAGYVWTIDGQGHQVKKWSPDGSDLLLTVGEFGVSGNTPGTFDRPTDIAFAPNGDFFVSDGYGNTRVVKFSPDGDFLLSWGTPGTGAAQFNLVHTLVVDKRNRVLVGDRENSRIQIFDLVGNYLGEWTHLGSPYGLYVTDDDLLFVADLVSTRVWIADADTGELLGTIEEVGSLHWVAVDDAGNVYTATPATEAIFKEHEQPWHLRKYQRLVPG